MEQALHRLEYLHVDVFSSKPYGGNSLPVFWETEGLQTSDMLAITRELRHFESIFLGRPGADRKVSARIFDLIEELPFAGHPLIGAAVALQHRLSPETSGAWSLDLSGRLISVQVTCDQTGYRGVLDQGKPSFLSEVSHRLDVAHAFSLTALDLDDTLPLVVASTGLRYLIVPVRSGAIERAKIRHDITATLSDLGAQFAVLFDREALEIRHWNNDGIIEDVATGSAAGVVGAFAVSHGVLGTSRQFELSQGRFAGRPSKLHIEVEGAGRSIDRVKVGGAVSIVGGGYVSALPERAE